MEVLAQLSIGPKHGIIKDVWIYIAQLSHLVETIASSLYSRYYSEDIRYTDCNVDVPLQDHHHHHHHQHHHHHHHHHHQT